MTILINIYRRLTFCINISNLINNVCFWIYIILKFIYRLLFKYYVEIKVLLKTWKKSQGNKIPSEKNIQEIER